MGLLSDILPDLAVAGVQAVTRGGPRRQYKWNKKAAEDANRMNRENQQWLLQQNKELQAEQRNYDSPSAQRARYIAAGINPNYGWSGGGGSAGGAFPVDAGAVGSVNIQPPSASYPDIAGSFMQAGQISAQTQLAQQRVNESEVNQALKEVMVDIAKTNPMLNPAVASSIAASMMAVAQAKEKDAKAWWAIREITTPEGWRRYTLGEDKIEREVEALSQRLGLNTEDLKIKNEILEGLKFRNALMEVQKKWLEDGELSPEHIRQGFMLLMQKLLGPIK